MTKNRRLTIVITPELEACLDEVKQRKFYNCPRSVMLRQLITAGLKETKEKERN